MARTTKQGEKILTKHPDGMKGVNIDRRKYDLIKAMILECLKENELTYTEIADQFEKDSFIGLMAPCGGTSRL